MDVSISNENMQQSSQMIENSQQPSQLNEDPQQLNDNSVDKSVKKNKTTNAEKAQMIQTIKRGFAIGNFSTKDANPKVYPGDHWKKGLSLIYARDGTKVDAYYFCKECNDVYYANPSNGSAPYNRHIKSMHNEKDILILSKLELAQTIHDIMAIAVRYNTVMNVETLTDFIPKKW